MAAWMTLPPGGSWNVPSGAWFLIIHSTVLATLESCTGINSFASAKIFTVNALSLVSKFKRHTVITFFYKYKLFESYFHHNHLEEFEKCAHHVLPDLSLSPKALNEPSDLW